MTNPQPINRIISKRTARLRSVAVAATAVIAGWSALLVAQSQARQFSLESSSGLRLHNVTGTPATLAGKRGLRVTMADETQKRLESMTGEQRQQAVTAGSTDEQLAVVEGLEFANGTIEARCRSPAAGSLRRREGVRGHRLPRAGRSAHLRCVLPPTDQWAGG